MAGLWKGVGPNIMRNALINAAELASYDQVGVGGGWPRSDSGGVAAPPCSSQGSLWCRRRRLDLCPGWVNLDDTSCVALAGCVVAVVYFFSLPQPELTGKCGCLPQGASISDGGGFIWCMCTSIPNALPSLCGTHLQWV